MTLEIVQIPVLHDNYVYLLRDDATDKVAVVDPAVVDPVVKVLQERSWSLDFILNTHHHPDHVGGNLRLKQQTGCQIVGPRADHERIPGIDTLVGEGEFLSLGESRAQVFDTPGHTRGHISYYFENANALFCGDTLFSIGCGRLFEGTPAQMWASLCKLRTLPDETCVYCAHEYTQANIRFAKTIDSANRDLRAYAEEVEQLRAAGKSTIPALLGREKKCNPFLRADDAILASVLGTRDAVSTFAEIRSRKDSF